MHNYMDLFSGAHLQLVFLIASNIYFILVCNFKDVQMLLNNKQFVTNFMNCIFHKL